MKLRSRRISRSISPQPNVSKRHKKIKNSKSKKKVTRTDEEVVVEIVYELLRLKHGGRLPRGTNKASIARLIQSDTLSRIGSFSEFADLSDSEEDDGAATKNHKQILKKSTKHKSHSSNAQKPWVCEICGMAFKKRYNMITHNRVHTGEKPYPCKYCDKRYTRSNNLAKHVRKIHKK